MFRSSFLCSLGVFLCCVLKVLCSGSVFVGIKQAVLKKPGRYSVVTFKYSAEIILRRKTQSFRYFFDGVIACFQQLLSPFYLAQQDHIIWGKIHLSGKGFVKIRFTDVQLFTDVLNLNGLLDICLDKSDGLIQENIFFGSADVTMKEGIFETMPQ